MRTLVLTPDFPPSRGGIQVLVHRLVTHATDLNPRVLTLGPGPAADEFDRGAPVDVRRVGTRYGGRQADVAKLNVVAVQEALRHRPDLVLSAHIVVSPAAAVIRRCLRIPVVQYLYAKEIGARPGLARFAIRNADAVIAISRYTQQLALDVGADAARMALIPPGVDLPDAGVDSDRNGDGRPRLVTVARLEDRYKGHDVIARALPLVRARLPEVEWVVVGDGPLRKHLEQLVRSNGVSGSVRFVGSVSDAERDRWLRSADVFAMPSRLPARGLAGEGFGIVYLEANARGLPVVAGGVAGALDAVVDGETGLLVDADDHFAVAEAVSALLLDPDRARALGEAGVVHSRRFAWPAIAERVESLCRQVAEAGA
jgi:glycosyltransferase involved in cell wall biosynthesis